MHFKLLFLFYVLFYSLLDCILSKQGIGPQTFKLSLAGRYQCPDTVEAYDGMSVEMGPRCAHQCKLSKDCIAFSFYSSSRSCYLFNALPSEVSYDIDCTFMMDWHAYADSDCTALGLVHGSCRGPTDDSYGCLSLSFTTSSDDTYTVCPVLEGVEMQMETVNITFNGGLILLPSVTGWIITMQRFDGTLDFNRGWVDYRNGFGNIGRGEFWLGNEKVHAVTAQPGHVYQLRIEVKTNGSWYTADYETFSLDSEGNKYAIHVSGFSGNAGDSMTNTTVRPGLFHSGISFSTPDADNDKDPNSSCAAKFSAGWWHNNCWMACLTCLYESDFAWQSLNRLPSNGRLEAARMMVQSM